VLRVPGGSFIAPAGLVVLAAGVADRKARALKTAISFAPDATDAKRYLQRIDFFAELGVQMSEDCSRHDTDGRFVPLRRITDLKIARSLADQAAEFLETQLPDLSPSPLRMARFVIEELGANIVQHSGRAETGFGVAQAFSKSRSLQIAFADRGVGFLRSLKDNPDLAARIDDDAIALQFALSRGISKSSDKRTNMGMGLKLLLDFSDHLHADLWLASGSAILWRRTVGPNRDFNSRVTTTQPAPQWTGSWVCLEATLPA
jgi:anti-sigma regulatory factor (Ser/Thr protein kinase)